MTPPRSSVNGPDEAVWTAPGRVNLIGEHTDYNEGWVLPFALPLGVTARATYRDDDVLRATSSEWPDAIEVSLTNVKPGDATGWAAYVVGVAWSLRRAGLRVGGADVHLSGDLPVGAGLSSSAAVECSVAGALAELYRCELPASELVRRCHEAENEFVGVPSGVLDQSASVLCRAGCALFLDARTLDSRQVPLALTEQGLTFLVIDTRAPHHLVEGEYAARREQCRQAAAVLGVPALRDIEDLEAALAALPDEVLRRRVRHVVTENARVLQAVAELESGSQVSRIGPLLTASHTSLRDDMQVSCVELDLAVKTALIAGAHGARMTGGGFGGSAIALVDQAHAVGVGSEIVAAFDQAGMREPHVFAAVPSEGARSREVIG